MVSKIAGMGLKIAILTMLVTGSWGCARKPYIDVAYRLPDDTDRLVGRTVFIEIRDLRRDADIFNQRAGEQFKHFNGLFSLSLITPGDHEEAVGSYRLPMLFEKAFARRLQRLGVKVAPKSSMNIPVFQVKLNRFQISLIGQKWQAKVSYEVSLAQDTQMVAREFVSGSAERVRVVGSGGAEKVIGELFTDMINRLDIERLFAQGKL
ncbi:MAG: hypothetical protein CR984_00425 [Proteobacteria bacterium]|nr:MAG: hypothetical protein CR984_00425 [Pseudomonadota bacterium]